MARTSLVTGGAGFIGSNLADRLVLEGAEVRVIDNLITGSKANLERLDDSVAVEIGDLRDSATCRRVLQGVDTVYHLAAVPSVPRSLRDPWTSHDHNVNGTMRLLEAAHAAGVRRIVYSSSSSIYGDTAVLPKEEAVEPLPRSPYATSKLAGEQYVLAFARAGLVEGVALRYFNVFGPYQDPSSAYAAVIPAFLSAILEGRPAKIFGDGEQTRDFTHIDNVLDANLAAASAPPLRASGVAVNVGAGEQTSLNQLLVLLEDITGRAAVREYHDQRPGDVRDSLASLNRARDTIGYVPNVTLRAGLETLYEWWLGAHAAEAGSPAAGS